MGCTAGPIPAEQRGGAPAGHDPEGQRFPQRSRCPRWAVAAPDGRSSPRSQGGPARQRPQHPCGERQPSGAVSGPAPPPFHGHPLSDMAACLPASLPLSFRPSATDPREPLAPPPPPCSRAQPTAAGGGQEEPHSSQRERGALQPSGDAAPSGHFLKWRPEHVTRSFIADWASRLSFSQNSSRAPRRRGGPRMRTAPCWRRGADAGGAGSSRARRLPAACPGRRRL